MIFPSMVNGLSDDETALLNECLRRIEARLSYNFERRDMYEAAQNVKDPGVSIPPSMRRMQVAVGWPGLVVDSIDERLNIDRLVMPGGNISDTGADLIWDQNDLELLQHEAHIESLIQGVSFLAVTAGGEGQPEQAITVEPPTSMSGVYDPKRRGLVAAASVVRDEAGTQIVGATLYTLYATVQLSMNNGGLWSVDHRDTHNLGRVMVRRLVNRPRGSKQWGRSEITRSIISNTQLAVRTILSADVSRDIYGAPARWVAGMDPDDFVDASGAPTSPWSTYMGRILTLPRDEDNPTAALPQAGQFPASSPTPYIELVKMYSQLVAGEAGLPAHYLGFVSDNPASADQIRAVEARLVMRSEKRQAAFGAAWRGALIDAMTLRDGRDATELAGRLRVKWRDAGTPTKAASADRVMKLVSSGVLPPESDVVLEELDYDETDILRIQQDRRAASGRALAETLRAQGAAARTDPTVGALAAQRVPGQEPTDAGNSGQVPGVGGGA